MSYVLTLFVWNLVVATMMAIVLWPMCRTRWLRQRPAVCHALWALVLIKLVTPPLIPIPVLPSDVTQSAATRTEIVRGTSAPLSSEGSPLYEPASLELPSTVPNPYRPTVPSQPTIALTSHSDAVWYITSIALVATSCFVTIVLWFLAARQLHRVRRLLHGISPETGHVAEVVQQVAEQFKLRTAPDVLIVDAAVTPMMWSGRSRASILLPCQLQTALNGEELRNVVAHELAHLVRRDHWMNVIAFSVTTLMWWNPVAWLARRELTNAAEACCDALALERTSATRKSYVSTLLTVVEFVTSSKPLRPSLAVTFGESSFITRRCEMVADSKVKPHLSKIGFVLLCLTAVVIVMAPVNAKDKARKSERSVRGSKTREVQQPQATTAPNVSTLPSGTVDIDIYVEEAFCPELKLAGFWSMRLVSRDPYDTTKVEKGYMAFGFDPSAKEQTGFLMLEGDQLAQSFKHRFEGDEQSLWLNLDLGHEKVRGTCKIAEDGASIRIALVSGSDIGENTAIKLKKLTSPRLASPSTSDALVYSPYAHSVPITPPQPASSAVGAVPLYATAPQSYPPTTVQPYRPAGTEPAASPSSSPTTEPSSHIARVKAYIQSLRTIRAGDVVKVYEMPPIDPARPAQPIKSQLARVAMTHGQTDGSVELTLEFETAELAKRFERASGKLHLELSHNIKEDEERTAPNDTSELQGRWRLKETLRPDGFHESFDGSIEAIIAKDTWAVLTDGLWRSSKLVSVGSENGLKTITLTERNRANNEPKIVRGLYQVASDTLIILTSQSSSEQRPRSYDDIAVRSVWQRVHQPVR